MSRLKEKEMIHLHEKNMKSNEKIILGVVYISRNAKEIVSSALFRELNEIVENGT